MATDALLSLQSTAITKIAAFSSTAIILPKSSFYRAQYCRVIYSAASTSSGSGAATFGIDISWDNGSTFNVLSESNPVALSTTATSGELYLPIVLNRPDLVNNQTVAPQIRLSLEAISGTGATVTYAGEFSGIAGH